jgi:hypothetical protein
VSLVLPLLKNPVHDEKANQEGFEYVTRQMRYYTAMETLSLPVDMKNDVRLELNDRVIELYKLIIKFQIQTILRFYRSRTKKIFRAIPKWDNWEGMLKSIRDIETELDGKLSKALKGTSLTLLKTLVEEAVQSREHVDYLLGVQKEALQVLKDTRDIQQQMLQRQMSDDEKKRLALFYRTDYKIVKDDVTQRLKGTCAWFLGNEDYKAWAKSTSGPLLISADPGCGKSVLAKYLIDHELPRTTTICYFFFKYPHESSLANAICALIHQLMELKPELIHHIKEAHPGMTQYLTELWSIIDNACRDPDAGQVILVLDALDECQAKDLDFLKQRLLDMFSSSKDKPKSLKFLLTGRPYDPVTGVVESLKAQFNYVRIAGELETPAISEEIDIVVDYRVNNLKLYAETRSYLLEKLKAIRNRTYLWVHLVLRYIERNISLCNTDPHFLDDTIDHLSEFDDSSDNLDAIYERILSFSKHRKRTQNILKIVAAAYRPLSLVELKIAYNVSRDPKWKAALQVSDSDFEKWIRAMSGLFISTDQGQVTFLHQTAREFLISKDDIKQSPVPSENCSWRQSLTVRDMHELLAQKAMLYIVSEYSSGALNSFERRNFRVHGDEKEWAAVSPFFPYAAEFWPRHVRDLNGLPKDTAEEYEQLVDTSSELCAIWYTAWTSQAPRDIEYLGPKDMTSFTLRVLLGHFKTVQADFDTGADVDG